MKDDAYNLNRPKLKKKKSKGLIPFMSRNKSFAAKQSELAIQPHKYKPIMRNLLNLQTSFSNKNSHSMLYAGANDITTVSMKSHRSQKSLRSMNNTKNNILESPYLLNSGYTKSR